MVVSFKFVPRPDDGADIVGFRPELASQLPDVGVDYTAVSVEVHAPHPVEDRIPG